MIQKYGKRFRFAPSFNKLDRNFLTAIDLSITGKSRFGNLSQDRVVLTGNTGNVSREGLKLKITGAKLVGGSTIVVKWGSLSTVASEGGSLLSASTATESATSTSATAGTAGTVSSTVGYGGTDNKACNKEIKRGVKWWGMVGGSRVWNR